jgi:long-subunit fatty acid transport protein
LTTVTSIDSTDILSNGHAFHSGIQYNLKNLYLGLAGEYYLKNTATVNNKITDAIVNDSKPIDMQIAPAISVGAAYQFSPEFLAGIDFRSQFWENHSSVDMLTVTDLVNEYRIGLGVQYVSAPDILAPKYWETMRYRAGFQYTRLPVDKTYEYSLSFGVGLPVKQSSGLVDCIVEIGSRIDKNHDISEPFARFAIGISGGKKWAKTSTNTY